MVDLPKASAEVSTRKRTSLPEFARLLGQPATTVKRLFGYGILPGSLVTKSAGKHWRVSVSEQELMDCKVALVVWSVWRRKPVASKTYARRDELKSTAIRLILVEEKRAGRDLKAPDARIDAIQHALLLLQTKPDGVEAVSWVKRILANPTTSGVGAFVLRTAIGEFQIKHPDQRQPTVSELAKTLKISDRSLYRSPFGRDVLRLAYSELDLSRTGEEENPHAPDDSLQIEYARLAVRDYGREYRRSTSNGSHYGEETRRKLRKRRDRSFALEWQEDRVCDGTQGMLLMFPATRLQAKRRIEMVESKHASSSENAKRNARELRGDSMLRGCDETFGSRTLGAYLIHPDAKIRWWINNTRREGSANSIRQARREILIPIARAKFALSINNLDQMLAEIGLEYCRATRSFTDL